MGPSKLRQALGAAKDQTTIALARAGGADDEVAAEVEVAIVRATAHGEALPTDDRHVAEILALTRYSRARVAACVASVSRRLERTRTWPVSVKALALVHRLLAEGDPAFEQEVFLATRRGRRMLDMSWFRDRGRARSRDWDFAAFVHAYAVYLDDRLKRRMQGVATPRNWSIDGSCDGSFHETDGTNEVHEAWEFVPGGNPATETTTEDLIAKAQQLKHILDRFIDCRPTGKARTNRVVTTALYRLVKESAAMYCELTEVMVVLMDRFAELDTPVCVRVHSIFTSLAKLVDELDDFYAWCKATAVCRPSDVPEIQRVRQKNLDLMDEFIRDRRTSASQRSRSPPAPLSSPSIPVKKYGEKAIEPAPKEQQVTGREESNDGETATVEPDDSLVVVDDKMADFLNLDEDISSPPSGEEHGQNLTLALFEGNSAEALPKWVAFDDPSAYWETAALVQPTSWPGTQRAELGGGFNATALDAMYSHAAANATVTNTRAFAGSASSVATQPLGATVLALPPPLGANATAAAAGADPFAASLLVPPPTYVQMTDLQTRQRLLVQEQNAWQQYERQRAPWSNDLLLD
ncbi:putative clathrin assembly protein [Dichanthelium oligosanthes]|uniref:Putative clathrin assembly protein n=1 Tax=Dichanthelium oligosanthes TaxID=888268 RepID=A0A1E5UM42_9POAL|nr:putative clathrin assembly protein [Dichanthelium oligosanthes]